MSSSFQRDSAEFERWWLAVRKSLWYWCYRQIHTRDDTEDLVQIVAMRAWRGYADFRGDNSNFYSWVMAIARREVATYIKRKTPIVDIDDIVDTLPAPDNPDDSEPDAALRLKRLKALLPSALQKGDLTPREAKVLYIRFTYSKKDFSVIEQALGLKDGHGAVLQFRALPKFGAFLCMYAQEELGGRSVVEEAFENISRSSYPLTEEEADIFRLIVLEPPPRGRPSHKRATFRSACERIIKECERILREPVSQILRSSIL